MEYSCRLPPLSIEHPVFAVRPPFYRSPLYTDARTCRSGASPLQHPAGLQPLPGFRRLPVPGRDGVRIGAAGSACLLPHKSSPTKNQENLKPGPLAQEHSRLTRPQADQPLFDQREIIWQNPTPELAGLTAPWDDKQYWVQVYHSDVKIKRPAIQPSNPQPGKRGCIFGFSDPSMNRLLFTCRNSGHLLQSQFCCTYHNSWPLNGKALKEQLQALIHRIKRKYGRGIHYLWVLEFQERGAPHIHLFLDIPPTRKNRWFLADAWLDVSDQSGDVMCRRFHRNPKNFFSWEMRSGAYLAKEYIGKVEQKHVPESFHNVGRFWGTSRNMTPDFSTIDPRDEETAQQICIEKALRVVMRLQEKKIDQFKAYGCLYQRALDFFQLPHECISKKTKRQIALGIRLNGSYKTTRLRPKTNIRRLKRTVNLPGRSGAFFDVLNWLNSPPPSSGFKAFSRWADSPAEKEPPRTERVPF